MTTRVQFHVPESAQRWLATGERGISSETIFQAFTGLRVTKYGPDVPHDPDDFKRCRLLIEAVPEWRGRLAQVANVFPFWKPFVREWDSMCALMDEEVPNWRTGGGKAPKLWSLISRLEQEAKP